MEVLTQDFRGLTETRNSNLFGFKERKLHDGDKETLCSYYTPVIWLTELKSLISNPVKGCHHGCLCSSWKSVLVSVEVSCG